MFSFLTDLEINVVVGVVSAVLGMVFKTKLTDYFKGIPAQARTALNGVEKDTLDKIKGAQAQVLASLPIPIATIVKAPLPPAQQPLVAAAPVAQPVAAPAAPAAPAAAPVAPVAQPSA